jgi:hypothetical protein
MAIRIHFVRSTKKTWIIVNTEKKINDTPLAMLISIRVSKTVPGRWPLYVANML